MRAARLISARADELASAVFDGYVAGLREAGWRGAVEQVRLGYTAAVALRWTALAGILHMLVHGTEPVRNSQHVLVPADAVLSQRVRLAEFAARPRR